MDPNTDTQIAAAITPDTVKALAETAAQALPAQRPPVDTSLTAKVHKLLVQTDNTPKRETAVWEFNEATKTLFPSRFNVNDPRRGMVPAELRTKKDDVRVQPAYIYRDGLQVTALCAPEDLEIIWEAREQVPPPESGDPLGMVPTDPNMPPPVGAAGMPTAGSTTFSDPNDRQFARTLEIVQKHMLEEANWIEKVKAVVQDSDAYPLGILKVTFVRDFPGADLAQASGAEDSTEAQARLQGLLTRYADKQFDQNHADYQTLVQTLKSITGNSAIKQRFALKVERIPLDCFGVSEDTGDIVDIYESRFMFQDVYLTGEDMLDKYPFSMPDETKPGETYGILPSELAINAQPEGEGPAPQDRTTRARTRQPRTSATSATVTSRSNTSADPGSKTFRVRSVWVKRERKVYVIVKGMENPLACFTPEHTPEQWYPFFPCGPNRAPNEIYPISNLELKRDIQARIHRKRTQEERARGLSIPRGVYNKSAGCDEQEMIKIGSIPEGTLRGIAFGSQEKIGDLVQWWNMPFDPKSFDTAQDERDKDIMSAMPVQALGATGTANYAAEVQVASQGAAVAVRDRQAYYRRWIERILTASAQVLLQALTVDEVRLIAGPFAFIPTLYGDDEAQAAMAEIKAQAEQTVMPTVLSMLMAKVQQTGQPPSAEEIQGLLSEATAPVVAAQCLAQFGALEPLTRESMFARLRIKVRSVFASTMERQGQIQQFSMLAEACMQMGQAAQGTGTPFTMRPIVKRHADLIGGNDVVDEAFPAVSPGMVAQNMAQAATANAGAAPGSKAAPAGQTPENQGAPAKQPTTQDQAAGGQASANAAAPAGG